MGASAFDAGPGPHAPVLYQQVLSALEPRAGGHYIDGTLGAGGHARGILEACAPDGVVLGLDRDDQALALAAGRLGSYGDRLVMRRASFAEMAGQAAAIGWGRVDGILLDLGLSSMQLDDPKRGFSFRFDGPLDMRFDQRQTLTAGDIVNGWSVEALAEVLRRYGEQPRAGAVARAIVAARPITTTGQLAQVVAQAGRSRGSSRHPATQTFQALRIAVNGEMEALEQALEAVPGLLEARGRLVVISFHSLEDRLVKQFMRRESTDCLCPPRQPVCTCGHRATLTVPVRRAIRPDASEIRHNPRARSARLRCAERLSAA